jgi:coenzyme F420-reducing hydrogenase beta subunit
MIGRSLVIARTAAGDKLVRDAMAAGYLEMQPAPEKMHGLHQTQTHQVNKKRGILARLLAL